jgi:RNA polymerase sigma factor (sigma-70 family)
MVGVPQSIAFQEPGLAKQEHAAACDDSFTALVTRQARFVYRVAYSILRNSHDAEDVVQETFLKIYRARKWTSMANERAFLARVAWRIAVDRLPKARMEPENSDIPSAGANPEQNAISGDWTATEKGRDPFRDRSPADGHSAGRFAADAGSTHGRGSQFSRDCRSHGNSGRNGAHPINARAPNSATEVIRCDGRTLWKITIPMIWRE